MQFLDNTAATILEESIVDPRTKTLSTFTKNITLTKYMAVEETCVYTVAPENTHWCGQLTHRTTPLTARRTKTASNVSVRSSLYIATLVEKFGVERFRSNVKKAWLTCTQPCNSLTLCSPAPLCSTPSTPSSQYETVWRCSGIS